MAGISDFVTSKTRIEVLKLFLSNINEMYHVRGVVRETKDEINAVRRELARLERAGILKKEPRGNRVYYWARKDYTFFGELLSLVAKTTGLGEEIRSNRGKLGRLLFVMFSGPFTRRAKRRRDDDVDILVVGEVVLPELAALIRKEEAARKHEINYTVMSREEFDFRKKRRDPFLQNILYGSRVMILGDEAELVA